MNIINVTFIVLALLMIISMLYDMGLLTKVFKYFFMKERGRIYHPNLEYKRIESNSSITQITQMRMQNEEDDSDETKIISFGKRKSESNKYKNLVDSTLRLIETGNEC